MSVLGVISLLVALLLPAAQKARESARRAQCSNNLHQIAIASQNYLSAHRFMPPLWTFTAGMKRLSGGGEEYSPRQYSIFTQILPYMDNITLYNMINFNAALGDVYYRPDLERVLPGLVVNGTCIRTTVSAFLCPSDGASGIPPGQVNYRGNAGSERWLGSNDGPLMVNGSPCTDADIHDGFSNTAMFTEKIRGALSRNSFAPRSDMMYGGLGLGFSVDQSILACERVDPSLAGYVTPTGLTWVVGSFTQTFYNHAMVVNPEAPDCILDGSTTPSGLVGARSDHPSGVNVAFVDGSVRFVSNPISIAVWRALGTRSGGEIANY